MERLRSLMRPARSRLGAPARRFPGRLDAALALALAVLAAAVGAVSVSRGEPGSYYQHEFEPAVLRACGQGFANYIDPEGSRVDAFLARETQTVDCAAVADPAYRRDANVFQLAHRYLLETAGLLFRLGGLSWDSLLPLFAALYALAAASLYGLFRLAAGRVLATLGTLALVFSPLQLEELRHLRDYAKVPFLLAAFFLAALLATRPLGPRTTLLAGAGGGLLLGVGFGFRADVLVALPLLFVALLVLGPGEWRATLRLRLATLAVLGGVFLAGALPVILTLSSGGNLYLMGVHGQTAFFTDSLELEQDLYRAGTLYNDPYAVSLANAHDLLVDGNARELQLATVALDEASSSRYFSVVRHLPADFLVRADAAVLEVLDLGPAHLAEDVPERVDALGMPGALRDGLGFLLGPLEHGWLVVLAALVVGAARSPRLAVAALLAMLFLGSLISFQANIRHAFYLEFVWWLAAAYLARQAWLAATGGLRRPEWRRPALGAVVLLVVLAAATIVPLAAARAYQSRHLEDVLERYERAPRAPVETSRVPVGEHSTLVAVPDESPAWRGVDGARAALFAARFNGRRCAYPQLRPELRYQATTDYEDWTTELDVRFPRSGDARVTAYFVAFARPTTHFTGIVLPNEALPCLEGLEAVDTEGLPVLLDALLPVDWREVTRYQTFAWEDRRPVGEGRPYVAANPPATPSYPELHAGEPLTGIDETFRADGVRTDGDGFRFAGEPDGPFTYLSVSRELVLAAGQTVVVHGRLREGGVKIGLQQAQQWVLTTEALEPGEFWAVLAAPAAGPYQLVIAHELPDGGRQDVVVEDVRLR